MIRFYPLQQKPVVAFNLYNRVVVEQVTKGANSTFELTNVSCHIINYIFCAPFHYYETRNSS